MTPSPTLDFSKNVSYFTIPIVFVTTCIGPQWYAIIKGLKIYDNANPRGFRDALTKCETLDKQTQQRILRAKSSSENSYENVGVFAAGVVAANQVGLDTGLINTLALAYLVSRLAFVFVYVQLGQNRNLSWMRTTCFAVSSGLMTTMWIRASLKAIQW